MTKLLLSENTAIKLFGFWILSSFLYHHQDCRSDPYWIPIWFLVQETLLNPEEDWCQILCIFLFLSSCVASVGVLFSPLVSSPPYLEFLTFSFLLARSVHLISQLYSLQLSEDNNDVRVWLPVAAIMRSFLCFHFVPGCLVHLMSWKFFKISFWGCFVTATFSECGLYLWKMMACGIAKGAICDWDDSNRILPTRVASYDSGTSTFLPSPMRSLKLIRPRRSETEKNTFYLICGLNYVQI